MSNVICCNATAAFDTALTGLKRHHSFVHCRPQVELKAAIVEGREGMPYLIADRAVVVHSAFVLEQKKRLSI